MKMRTFMQENFKHFNAAVCVEAAEGWITHLQAGENVGHPRRSYEYCRIGNFSS